MVRANGEVQVLGGTRLSLGISPRLSAMPLAVSMIPITAAWHAFWNIEDPSARKAQRVQFHKNLATSAAPSSPSSTSRDHQFTRPRGRCEGATMPVSCPRRSLRRVCGAPPHSRVVRRRPPS